MKSVIYETSGRAREYSELALNLFNHCEHGCVYCYAPAILHTTKESFREISQPRVTIEDIKMSAQNYAEKKETRRILLCFTCDPYTPMENETQITRKTIEILHNNGLNVIILTKGGYRSIRDFDLLTPKDAYATTLTLTDNSKSFQWEMGAGLPMERIKALRLAHAKGAETWVSFEPVIYPEETFKLLDMTHRFVGHYKVGTMNYHPQGLKTNWHDFVWEIKKRMDDMGVKYYFKKDLLLKMGVKPEEFKQTWVCG